MRQLEAGLGELHQAGIIWGDAKPENILVDKNNDFRIIDFEGGYTEGWIDQDQAGQWKAMNKRYTECAIT